MDILEIGSGGREYAHILQMLKSPECGTIHAAPGNGGTARLGPKVKNVPIKATDIDALLRYAKENKIGLTVVGPEDPLVANIVGLFRANGLRIVGPTGAAALHTEGDKALAYKLMVKYDIPTARSHIFTDYEKALDHLRQNGLPIVIKAAGLALGKGVLVEKTDITRAIKFLHDLMVKRTLGDAGAKVLICECLTGWELSMHVLCDGEHYLPFPTSMDHKPVNDGNEGLNTGGMGAISPVPAASERLLATIDKQIVRKMVLAMAAEGIPYTGCLYPGLMITDDGPKVLEDNCRFGDPETQVILPRLKTDFLEILDACADGRLDTVEPEWLPGYSVTIAIVSGGYPGKCNKGYAINGIDKAQAMPGVTVIHGGTVWDPDQETFRTAGGRVLYVTGEGYELPTAIERANTGADCISFKDMHRRTDIGLSALAMA